MASNATCGTFRHVLVYGGQDIACGWPSNHGVWAWEDGEILVGFTCGKSVDRSGHNIDEDGVIHSVLARSTDGGETWAMEDPANFAGDGKAVSEPTGDINFAHPDFAMSVKSKILRGMSGVGESFWYSYDRGRSWHGPYNFGNLMGHPELAGMEFTARTDYITNASDSCLFFISARQVADRNSIRKDQVFLARTTNSGKTFEHVSWVIGPDDPYRAVMSSSVRCSATKLLTTIRRRAVPRNVNWIDACVSEDNGESWAFLSRVGDTGSRADDTGRNGNPPALVRLRDGRLCCVYGDRGRRNLMLAKLSSDEGATWSSEVVLRNDYNTDAFGDADLGYPQLVQRPDGKLVAIYYWATARHTKLHIAATIWEP
jgi:hypothetical protein